MKKRIIVDFNKGAAILDFLHALGIEYEYENIPTPTAPAEPHEMLESDSLDLLWDNILSESPGSGECRIKLRHEHSCGIPLLNELPDIIHAIRELESRGTGGAYANLLTRLEKVKTRLNAGPVK